MINYIVIENNIKDEFEKNVESHLLDGWELVGGVSFDSECRFYFQSMILIIADDVK